MSRQSGLKGMHPLGSTNSLAAGIWQGRELGLSLRFSTGQASCVCRPVWTLSALGCLGDGRAGWAQNKSTLSDFHARVGIGGDCQCEALDKIFPEASQPLDLGSELGVKR